MSSTDNWLETVQARLIREAGRWTLELSETVRIDRNVLGSRRRSVLGEEAILKHVNTHVRDPSVVRATAQLFRSCREERSFEMFEGEWYPMFSKRPTSEERDRAYRDAITEFQQEIRTLASKEKKLEKVVAALEARVRTHARAPAENAPDVAGTLGRGSVPRPATPELAGAQAQPVENPRVSGEVVPAAVVRESRIELPSKLEILTCLKQLFGQDLRPEYAKKPPLELRVRPSGHYVCELVDQSGTSRGAVIVDTRGCAELGGTLLGLPDTAIAEQLLRNELSADTLEGMSEVGNNLSGIVNNVSPDCHIRSLPLAPVDWDGLSWVEQSSRACVLTTQQGGALWLVAR